MKQIVGESEARDGRRACCVPFKTLRAGVYDRNAGVVMRWERGDDTSASSSSDVSIPSTSLTARLLTRPRREERITRPTATARKTSASTARMPSVPCSALPSVTAKALGGSVTALRIWSCASSGISSGAGDGGGCGIGKGSIGLGGDGCGRRGMSFGWHAQLGSSQLARQCDASSSLWKHIIGLPGVEQHVVMPCHPSPPHLADGGTHGAGGLGGEGDGALGCGGDGTGSRGGRGGGGGGRGDRFSSCWHKGWRKSTEPA